ncbi:MAG: hypothetical protein IKV94_01950 [Clostridia bacterium]|nr:hypothetical protein [Clostridia bacterium]
MPNEELWLEFEKTGKVEDYLKYKLSGVENTSDGEINETVESKGSSN